MQISKATISIPTNAEIEGYVGRIFLTNGKVIKVFDKQICEAQEIGENFTWDYFPFDTKAECEAAVRRRVAQIRSRGH